MQDKIIKVAVVGPESTGKSTVAEGLARRFGTVCVPEYSRYYCENLDRNYTLQDELNIFYGQIALEKSLYPLANNQLLICDTMFLTVKIWCDHLFGQTPKPVLDALKQADYDLYLLMDIDLPWQDDPLRDFPDLREHFMQIWHQELQALGAEYVVIRGLGDSRLAHAQAVVSEFLSKQNQQKQ